MNQFMVHRYIATNILEYLLGTSFKILKLNSWTK